jgi:hypothetical protein
MNVHSVSNHHNENDYDGQEVELDTGFMIYFESRNLNTALFPRFALLDPCSSFQLYQLDFKLIGYDRER